METLTEDSGSEVLVRTNKYQTPVTQALLDSLPQQVAEQLMEALTGVEFIKNLISPDRPYYRDLPRDEQGKAIVDITNPPILEDADYFRQAAIHFQQHGCYTFLRPNSNPNSEFRKFWDREIDRCLNGYLRESDGAWISGYNYFFLNYLPMLVNKVVKKTKKAIRVEEFPFLQEGNIWRFYYLHNAREQGHHAIELAKRGAHPYFQEVYTPEGVKRWGEIKIGDKLFGTYGNITTVIDIPFDKECDFYKIELSDGRILYASDDHLWNIGVGTRRSRRICSTIDMYNDKNFKLSSGYCKYAIPNNRGVEYKYREVPIDSYTLGCLLGDGTFRHTSAELTQSSEDLEKIAIYIPYSVRKADNSGIHWCLGIQEWSFKLRALGLYKVSSENKFVPDVYKYNSREVRYNMLRGLMDTDGWCSKKRSPQFCTVSARLRDDVVWLARSLGYKASYITKKAGYKKDGRYIHCKDSYIVTIVGGGELFNLPRKQEAAENNCPTFRPYTSISRITYIGKERCKCVTVDSKDNCYLIGDFVTTHNCAKSYSLASMMVRNLILGRSEEERKRTITVLTAYQKEYLSDSKDGTLSKFKPAMNFLFSNTPFPHLMLKNSPNEMTWQMGYKDEYGIEKGSLNQVLAVSAKDDSDKLRGKRADIFFEEMGTFPNLISLYDVTRKSVEDGNYTFGTMYLVGTASESESDFSSAKTLLYNTGAYNILSLPNVYDKKGQGKASFGYFFPAYVNRAGCYNKDGVSDVVKALIEILMARYNAKFSSDPKTVLRVIAEDPITPAEAIIKVKAAYFPVTALTERLQQLDTNPHAYDDVYIGHLSLDNKGQVKFTPSNDTPIRKYGVDNDTPGALEIFAMPEKGRDGKVPHTRYIIGHDPVDNDVAESSSLSSTFVLDLWTDSIVAEYTGRQKMAEDNYEIVRLLCLFYNAKCLYESNVKGLYAYFRRMNCTHLLADTPEYLRDKQLIKYSSFGNNQKGVTATAAINNYANGLIRDWLIRPVPMLVRNDNGEEMEVSLQNLYRIRNRALLEELIAFNPELNVDRIRALGLVMLYREEKMILYQGNPSRDRGEVPSNYLGNDPFFKKNYDMRFIKKIPICHK